MVKKMLVVGRPNVGKTLFTLQFAAYLGSKNVTIAFRDARSSYTKKFSVREAVTQFVSKKEHQTRSLQTITVNIRQGKGVQECQLIDSVGLIDHIHPQAAIRQAMGQTLAVIPTMTHFLHLIDASTFQKCGPLEQHLVQLGELAHSYAIIANKWDLVQNQGQLDFLRNCFPKKIILTVSSLHLTGFKEVKAYVRSLF